MEEVERLLNQILAVQVMQLALTLKAREGKNTTSDYIDEAARHIKSKRSDALKALASQR